MKEKMGQTATRIAESVLEEEGMDMDEDLKKSSAKRKNTEVKQKTKAKKS